MDPPGQGPAPRDLARLSKTLAQVVRAAQPLRPGRAEAHVRPALNPHAFELRPVR